MTWKQFKEAVEKHGMQDNDNIFYIDFPGASFPRVIKNNDEARIVHYLSAMYNEETDLENIMNLTYDQIDEYFK